MVDIAGQLRAELSQPPISDVYKSYFLITNPFPAPGIESVFPMVDQEEANRRVLDEISRFLRQVDDRNQPFRLLITSDYAGGKTHFLKHYIRSLEQLVQDGVVVGLHTVYVKTPESSVPSLIGRVLEGLGGVDFVVRFVRDAADYISESQNLAEFRDAVITLKDAYAQQIEKSDDQELTQETMGKTHILLKWLTGEKCTEREKSALGVHKTLDTSSEVIDHFAELLRAANHANILNLLLIAVDEFETISSRAVTPRQRERYLLDLRYFLDTVPKNVMLVLASMSYVVGDLRDYAAILRRLQPLVQLELVQPESAIVWAAGYLIDARETFLKAHPDAKGQIEEKGLIPLRNTPDEEFGDAVLWPLTSGDVLGAFNQVKLRNELARPGEFLAQLHDHLKAHIEPAAVGSIQS